MTEMRVFKKEQMLDIYNIFELLYCQFINIITLEINFERCLNRKQDGDVMQCTTERIS